MLTGGDDVYAFGKSISSNVLPVTVVYKDGTKYLLTCPHCGCRRGVDAAEGLVGVVGEQYQDNICGGWFEIVNEVREAVNIGVLDEQPFALQVRYEEDSAGY